MIKAIIFDMDGVLIEAKDWHYEALNQALRLFGYEISYEEHLTTYDGLSTRQKLNILSQKHNLPYELHTVINELKQLYTWKIVYEKCKPRFIHEYALSKLKAEGYRLALASNSIRGSIDMMMEKAHLTHYFDAIFSNEDVVNPKPSPEIYTKAINHLGFKPHECLIVEDNEKGIEAATKAGGHLLIVKEVTDVNYLRIKQCIDEIREPLLKAL